MKKILSFILVIVILSLCNFSAFAITEEEVYRSRILELLEIEENQNPLVGELCYKEIYKYNTSDASSDEVLTKYVLVYLASNEVKPMPIADVYGEYIIWAESASVPFDYGYGIYIPESNEIYDLADALKMDIEGIGEVFTKAGVGRLLGDMDRDRKLTVKDATYIQKILAGVEGFTEPTIYAAEFDNTLPISISDFNRDRVRNIKDATAIQKHIAGIKV